MIPIIAALIITAGAKFSPTAMTVEGVVTQFDEKTIQLKQKNGAVVTVPRDSHKTMQGVKLGKDIMKLQVESSDFLKLNAHFFEGKPNVVGDKASEAPKAEPVKEAAKPKANQPGSKKNQKRRDKRR